MVQSLGELIEKIKIFEKLPGRLAHSELSPLPLNLRQLHYTKSDSYRIGAVAVLLYVKNEQPYFVVTQRHDYAGAHSGQISFPGGKYEETDIDTEYTALRETEEEIGINPNQVEILSALSELYIPPSNFLVYPYVGIVNGDVHFERDTFEVKEVIELTVAKLLQMQVIQKPLMELSKTAKYQIECPCFDFDGKIIWGATAMILNELRHILLQ
jgi:8-oxo-dGTP pyrophosphatase MutT (NUDIX family)